MSEHIAPPTPPSIPPQSALQATQANPTAAAAPPIEVEKQQATKVNLGDNDPMRELLERMGRMHQVIASTDPKLATVMQGLSHRGADPDQRAQPGFRTDVAYALQDVEKFHLGRLDLPAPLRTEMTQLAGTAVGLTNERLVSLMQATGRAEDRSLISNIREVATEVGRKVEQRTAEVESRIDALENRVRLSARTMEPGPNTSPEQSPTNSNRPAAPVREQDVTSGLERNRIQSPIQTDPRLQDGTQTSATFKNSTLDTLLRAMRPDAKQDQAPWEPPATPMADRLAAFERTRVSRADDGAFAGLESRGRATLEALQAFTNREGAAVMGRIEAAAKAEPGGMAQVLSEMRQGGKFEGLRQEFAGALAEDKSFAAAYEKAGGALAAYGRNRTDVEAIVSRRPDATAFTARLEKLDSEIGTAASNTPSKTEGQSMMEDITKRAAELLQKAVDAVRAAFTRSPSPAANSSPSPGP